MERMDFYKWNNYITDTYNRCHMVFDYQYKIYKNEINGISVSSEKRNKVLTIRLTEDEFEFINKKLNEIGISKSEALLKF